MAECSVLVVGICALAYVCFHCHAQNYVHPTATALGQHSSGAILVAKFSNHILECDVAMFEVDSQKPKACEAIRNIYTLVCADDTSNINTNSNTLTYLLSHQNVASQFSFPFGTVFTLTH